MESLLHDMLAWIELHPHAFNVIVFFIALFESLVVLGLLIPGAALLFGAGALIATGALPVAPIMIWTIAGAICGDLISFLLGRHYHQRLRVIWPFRRYPRLVNRGVDFFVGHGGKSVFMARFFGPLRPIVPAIAGMMNMGTPRFLLVDVFASILWAPVYILPGMVFGASLGLAAEVAGRLVVVLVFIVAIAWLGFWLINGLIRILQPHAASLLERILNWSRNHPLIRPLAGSLLDPNHPEARGLAVLSLVFFVTLWLLMLISRQVLHGHLLAGIDSYVFNTFANLRTPWVDSFMVFVTQFGEQLLLAVVLCTAVVWLLWKRCTKAAMHWLLVYITTGLLTWLLKITVQIERPTNLLDGYSYPSAHTSMSLAVYGFLALMIARELPLQRRWLPYTAAGLVVTLIALSRLYLGAHWFSDILAGFSLGIIWVALFGIAYDRHPAPRLPVMRLLGVTVLLVAITAAFQSERHYNRQLALYAPRIQLQQSNQADWLASEWETLPAYRVDLEGRDTQPMNFQWGGSLDSLQAILEGAGWSTPHGLEPLSAINWLAPEPLLSDLPVLPQVHDGKHQKLLMAAPLQENTAKLLIIRLWPSSIGLQHGEQVWIGATSYLQLEQELPLVAFLRTTADFDTPMIQLENTLLQSNHVDVVKQTRTLTDGHWQGQVLLGWERK